MLIWESPGKIGVGGPVVWMSRTQPGDEPMRFLELALKAIPEAATNPFAFLAYALAVGAWLWVAHRTARLKVLGDQAKSLTKKDFADLIRREEGTPLPPVLDPEQWILWQRQRNYLLAFLALCFVLLTLDALTAWYAARSQTAVAVVAAAFSVPLLGLASLGAWVVVRSSDTELARLRKEIDRAESELQTALDREKQQLGLVHEASGRASTLALYHPADPAIQGLADNLKRLVEEFKAHVGTKPLSGADGRRLRIAEGLVANAERRYVDALALVPEQDAATAFALARAQVEQAVKANQVRADAFYGLQRWRDALAYYQRILELRPDDRSAALMAGNCFLFLGQL
jgi:tetratricopeptide (TPR) repeat protein